MIISLDDFKIYNQAMKLGEQVWSIVIQWNSFEKDTIGKQLLRSIDSIAANLSEGLGRFHFKDSKNFSYYARGSLFEAKTWIAKANQRNLISEEQFTELNEQLDIGKDAK
jgi:four helix bundle protein